MALIVLPGSVALAQTERSRRNSRPAAVIATLSVKNYAALRTSLDYLATLSGQNQFPQMLDGMITAFTGGHGLLGIDKTRPFGMSVLGYGGKDSWPLVFVPIDNQEKALQLLQAVGPLLMRRFGPMPYKLTSSWFIIGPALGQVPEDRLPNPSRLVDANAWDYDVALTLNAEVLPMHAVQEGFDTLDQVAKMPLIGSDRASRQGQMLAAMALKSIGQFAISGTKKLTLGLLVSATRRTMALEAVIESRPGTDLDHTIDILSTKPSRLAALVDPAGLLSVLVSIPLDRQSKAALLAMMPAAPPPGAPWMSQDGQTGAHTPLMELMAPLRKTIDAGRIEVAFSVRGNPPGPLTLVGAAYLADAKAVEKFLLKQMEVDRSRGRLELRRDVTKFRTVPIHEIEFPVPREQQKFFGRSPKLHFGTIGNTLHVAFGGYSVEAIKWAVDRVMSSRSYSNQFSPLLVRARVRPWLQLAANEDPSLKSLEQEVSSAERVSLVVSPSSGTLEARLEIQEGLLRLIGRQASQQRPAGNVRFRGGRR